ncbi:MAG: biopolymer transporter Tol [Candidatus Neomarinimicrobiota bacterium]|nr:MAG: biopolymer transporter Tol [Candidatus Neomarinimicrobiota bacterium]
MENQTKDMNYPEMKRSYFRLASVCFLFFLLLNTAVLAQFGKNKVRYDQYDWSYIQTDHFDIYFHDKGEELARFAAPVAEEVVSEISRVLNWRLRKRVSVIIYNSHSDFQQTNVTQGYLTEGILGFTELLKNRSVLAFDGSINSFRHLIRHELVHVVVNDMIYGGSIQSVISGRVRLQIPLWMNEGLAEYISMGWDTNADMILRDIATNNDIPNIRELDYYLAYKGGQSVYRFIADRYGVQKIGEIWANMKGRSSAEKGIEKSIGLNMEELTEAWHKWVRKKYWPDIADRDELDDIALRLTDHKKLKNYFNTGPAINPDGTKIAMMSDRKGYADIFLIDAIEGKVEGKLVGGQRTPDLEELKWLNPRLSWSPDGKKIVLAVKSGRKDALIVVDVATKKRKKYTFPDIDELFTAAWSPEGDRIAFIGLSGDRTDLYLYDITSDTLTRLTNDWASDFEPNWSPDGTKIIFVSQRNINVNDMWADDLKNWVISPYNQTDLFVYDLTTGQIAQITDTPWNENYPAWANTENKIFYTSDAEGISNLYVRDMDTGKQVAVTNVLTGIFQPSLSRDDSRLVFAGYADNGWDVYLINNPLKLFNESKTVKPTAYAEKIKKVWSHPEKNRRFDYPAPEDIKQSYTHRVATEKSYTNYIFAPSYQNPVPDTPDTSMALQDSISYKDEKGEFIVNPYKTKFSLDLIDSQAGYNTFWGFQGTTVFAFSDVLGNHQLIFGSEMYIDLENSDYYLAYQYLKNRTNYGITGFHTANFWYYSLYYLYRLRNYGVDVSLSRPFSRFSRIEMAATSYNVEQKWIDTYTGQLLEEPVLIRTILPRAAFVFDNTLWGYFYPIDGWRWRFDVTASPKYNEASLEFQTIQADIRRYFKLNREYSFALRLAGGLSTGPNAQRFFLGGESNWINQKWRSYVLDTENESILEDIYFSEFVTPLRGARYYERAGNRYFLTNFEFRYPFIKYLALGWPLPMTIGGLQGITFLDIGGAWYGNDFHPFTKDSRYGTAMDDLVSGFGVGTRIFMGYFLLKIDCAWRYDMIRVWSPQWYFSLGLDF